MSRRVVTWLAWSFFGLCVALVALTVLLQNSTPEIERRGWLTPASMFIAVLWLTYPTVGALVVSRQPKNPIGWIFCAAGIGLIATICLQAYADYAVFAQRGELPATRYVAWAAQSGFGLAVVFLTTVLLFLLFPHGRPPSRGWWAVAWAAVVGNALAALSGGTWPGPMYDYPSIDNPFGLEGRSRDIVLALGNAGVLIILLTLVASLISVLVRWEQAGEEERRQLKWFTISAVPIVMIMMLAFWWGGFGVAALLPIAAGIAIFKHRLYDIDIIINRALVYGSLTGILALVYFAGVTATQAFLQAFTDQERLPQLVIVASTLAIAALFSPLRRRIQGFIDRRFYRRKYDAAKTLEAFSAKLRNETDLDTLSDDLGGVVQETMQPAHVSMWLRSPTAVTDRGSSEST
jgi:MFS family permease